MAGAWARRLGGRGRPIGRGRAGLSPHPAHFVRNGTPETSRVEVFFLGNTDQHMPTRLYFCCRRAQRVMRRQGPFHVHSPKHEARRSLSALARSCSDGVNRCDGSHIQTCVVLPEPFISAGMQQQTMIRSSSYGNLRTTPCGLAPEMATLPDTAPTVVHLRLPRLASSAGCSARRGKPEREWRKLHRDERWTRRVGLSQGRAVSLAAGGRLEDRLHRPLYWALSISIGYSGVTWSVDDCASFGASSTCYTHTHMPIQTAWQLPSAATRDATSRAPRRRR